MRRIQNIPSFERITDGNDMCIVFFLFPAVAMAVPTVGRKQLRFLDSFMAIALLFFGISVLSTSSIKQ